MIFCPLGSGDGSYLDLRRVLTVLGQNHSAVTAAGCFLGSVCIICKDGEGTNCHDTDETDKEKYEEKSVPIKLV